MTAIAEIKPIRDFRKMSEEPLPGLSEQTRSPPKPQKVSKSIINFVLDAALLIAAVFLLWVSVVMRMVFPAPTSADGWTLWGLSYDRWHDIQFSTLCVVTLLALEHLVLHWNWVCGMITTKILRVRKRPDEANQAVYGVATFITLLLTLLAGLAAAMLAVKRSVP